jgi:hypothetical protein
MMSVYRTFALAVELLAGLAEIVGCSKRTPEPAKSSEIRWHGPATGYEDTTKPTGKSSIKP